MNTKRSVWFGRCASCKFRIVASTIENFEKIARKHREECGAAR